jgi:hypothetical protein
VGRHHCWAAGPLGLGFHVSLYIVVHLYAIQQFTILHNLEEKQTHPKPDAVFFLQKLCKMNSSDRE